MVAAPRHRGSRRRPTESPTKAGFSSEDLTLAPSIIPSVLLRHATRLSVSESSEVADHTIAVIGVGFVGESLLRQFSTVFSCIAFDVSLERIAELERTYGDLPVDLKRHIDFTTDPSCLCSADVFLISVPTLLHADRSVNPSHVTSAINTVLNHARLGSTIILESSVSVGTTRRLLGPYSREYLIGMSPERVDPGRIDPPSRDIPKLVSGISPSALSRIRQIYSRVYTNVVSLSSIETAEMTKLFENCFRMVNIAYVNEMSDLALRFGVNPREMVDAAETKPYGYMRFQPGLGVGGYCIPINPYYLLDSTGISTGPRKKSNNATEWRLSPEPMRLLGGTMRTRNQTLPVLDQATRCMWSRPKRMAKKFHRRATVFAAGSASGFPPSQSLSSPPSLSPRLVPGLNREKSTNPKTRTPHTRAEQLSNSRASQNLQSSQGQRLPRVLVVGLAFKPGQSELSHSPSLAFSETMQELGCARLAFYDPLVDQKDVEWIEKLKDGDWNRDTIEEEFDAVAVCMKQDNIDWCVVEQLRTRGRVKGRKRGRHLMRDKQMNEKTVMETDGTGRHTVTAGTELIPRRGVFLRSWVYD